MLEMAMQGIRTRPTGVRTSCLEQSALRCSTVSRRSRQQKPANRTKKRFVFDPLSLELTKARDEVMRGAPEITLLIGIYRTTVGGASLNTRLAIRREITNALPYVMRLDAPACTYCARVGPTERFLVLALALEEDSGDGLRNLYGSLEAPAMLQLWTASDDVPSVTKLEDWNGDCVLPPQAAQVGLLVDGCHPTEICKDDDYLSACAFFIEPTLDNYDELWRLGFESQDKTNQWTASVRVKLCY